MANVIQEVKQFLIDSMFSAKCLGSYKTRDRYKSHISCSIARGKHHYGPDAELCDVCRLTNVISEAHRKLEEGPNSVLPDRVWVVGRTNERPEEHDGQSWDFIGVAASELLAIAACWDEYYFIGPVETGKMFPKELVLWPGVYRPMLAQMGRSAKEQLGPVACDMVQTLCDQDVTVYVDPQGGKWLDAGFKVPYESKEGR